MSVIYAICKNQLLWTLCNLRSLWLINVKIWMIQWQYGHQSRNMPPQIARITWPTWGPPGSCRPQVGPMLAPWTLLSGTYHMLSFCYIWDALNLHLFISQLYTLCNKYETWHFNIYITICTHPQSILIFSFCSTASNKLHALKREKQHFDYFVFRGCTWGGHNEHLKSTQWLQSSQRDYIYVSVRNFYCHRTLYAVTECWELPWGQLCRHW